MDRLMPLAGFVKLEPTATWEHNDAYGVRVDLDQLEAALRGFNEGDI